MLVKMILDDDELIVNSDKQFRKVLNDFGADGMIWFNKDFIRNYVNALYLKIDQLEKALNECEKNDIQRSRSKVEGDAGMKAVLISIRPKWCELIASGEKTIEVRKTKPKLEIPFKCYIYCTDGFCSPDGDAFSHGWRKQVIGEFVCDRIDRYNDEVTSASSTENFCRWNDFDLDLACIHPDDLEKYASGKDLYGWHISDLVIYDEPKDLGEFKKIYRNCWYADLGLAKRDCAECKNKECFITRPPQSWCYVEGSNEQII